MSVRKPNTGTLWGISVRVPCKVLRVFVKSKVCFNVKCEVPKGLLDIRKIIVLEKSDFWFTLGSCLEEMRVTSSRGAQQGIRY